MRSVYPHYEWHSGRGYQDDGPFVGPFWAKKQILLAVKKLFCLPRPPWMYFDPLYLAKIDLVSGQPKKYPADPISIFSHVFAFVALCDPFLLLFWP